MIKSVDFLLIFIAAATSCVGCTVGNIHDPKAVFEIELTEDSRIIFVQQMEQFALENSFSFSTSNNLLRGDRQVRRIRLERDDGTQISADNFIEEGTMQIAFYGKKSNSDWENTVNDWLSHMRIKLGNSTKIVEVPVSSADQPTK